MKQALDKHGFDVAFGGARRDEEKSRAKERIFSFRNENHHWDPKRQRPELWNVYNARKNQGETIRVFPLSNWTELDIWQYIHLEKIPIVPLYLAKPRPVVERDGVLILVDDERLPMDEGEEPTDTWSVNFTASSDIFEIDWELFIDNSTCGIMIFGELMNDYEYYPQWMGAEEFRFHQPDCEFSLPVDITVDYVTTEYDYSGVSVESISIEELGEDGICEYADDNEEDLAICLTDYVTFATSDPEPSFIINMSGLEVGKNYSIEIEVFDVSNDLYGEGEMEWELYNWCGWEAQDSEPDNAWWCGDEEGDAEDWWYYCEWDEDGSIWYCTDDFGQDESFENTTGNNFRENSSVSGYMDFFMLNATSDFESYQISASLPDSS